MTRGPRLFLPSKTDWMDSASCIEVDSALFFDQALIADGHYRTVCASCVVRAQCLAYAKANREEFGVWGGVVFPGSRSRRKDPHHNTTTAKGPHDK